ncbi:MAG: DUF5398 family protein [Chlamydiia bacterium]|nr:DUF5398 family protein [Chlamydiia bacterium]
MFGMGKEKKGGGADWEFDLEKTINHPAEFKKIKEQLESSSQELKNSMRQGEDAESYKKSQKLLGAFVAAKKVVERASRK